MFILFYELYIIYIEDKLNLENVRHTPRKYNLTESAIYHTDGILKQNAYNIHIVRRNRSENYWPFDRSFALTSRVLI